LFANNGSLLAAHKAIAKSRKKEVFISRAANRHCIVPCRRTLVLLHQIAGRTRITAEMI
jgi:hypothetical protein